MPYDQFPEPQSSDAREGKAGAGREQHEASFETCELMRCLSLRIHAMTYNLLL